MPKSFSGGCACGEIRYHVSKAILAGKLPLPRVPSARAAALHRGRGALRCGDDRRRAVLARVDSGERSRGAARFLRPLWLPPLCGQQPLAQRCHVDQGREPRRPELVRASGGYVDEDRAAVGVHRPDDAEVRGSRRAHSRAPADRPGRLGRPVSSILRSTVRFLLPGDGGRFAILPMQSAFLATRRWLVTTKTFVEPTNTPS